MIGEMLSHFSITAKLGEGGMGTVYLAEDTKLGREVAIKVLPESVAADAERLARFEREAKVLASLNHPNIAAIYSFESDESVHFLVMELVDGEDLRKRLSKGQMSSDEAIPIALQIAEALEAAHEKGIIHRDLKPANIQIDSEGDVKILDFGLAKALDPDSGSVRPGLGSLLDGTLPADLSESPTLTAEMTREGVVLGTFGYMSPEQARGQQADRRTDIWAFGCVVYEMLTGERAFGGDTASDRLARILEREPHWEQLPEDVPAPVATLLRRCLSKDPRQRIHDMADVRLWLEEVPGLAAEESQAAPKPRSLWRKSLPWVAAAIGVGLGIGALIQSRAVVAPDRPVRFSPTSEQLAVLGNPSTSQVAITPDGTMLAYVVGRGHRGQLFLRRLDSSEPVPIEGAENVEGPFFSPDGSWVGFQDGSALKRVSVEGGKVWTICEAGYPVGATWATDGSIIYGDEPNFGLFRVPWDGGDPEQLTPVDREKGEYGFAAPQYLPHENAVLFTIFDDGAVARGVAILDLESGMRTDLPIAVGSQAQYLESGHLAYGLDGSLMVVPVDLVNRELTGEPVAVLDGLLMGSAVSPFLAHFEVAESGTLAYFSGPVIAAGSRLVRADRQGNFEPLGEVEERIRGPRFSPEGNRLTVTGIIGSGPMQVWVRDMVRGTLSRVTTEGENWWPVWSPDGRRIVFPTRQVATDVVNLAWMEADGTGPPDRLTQGDLSEQPTTWTPDGKTLIFHRNDHPETQWDILALDVEEIQPPRVLLGSRFVEAMGELSPDGRWLAYVSDEAGEFDTYVRPYPDLDRKWKISTGGGISPVWSPDGRELFYLDMEGQALMVVAIDTEPEFSAGRPELLLEGSFVPSGLYGRNYDVSPNGRDFVFVENVIPEDIDTQLQVVLNWFTELEELAPTEAP
jgi:serine/threonine-protein kinase